MAVLTEAIDAGGSTLGDAQYVDLMGEGGSYQDDHRVYGRGGERCLDLRPGLDPAFGHRRSRYPLVPDLSALSRAPRSGGFTGAGVSGREQVVSLLLCS